MDSIFNLLVGVVPAMFLVYVIVEGLKTYGLLDGDGWLTAPRAGVTAGLFLVVVALVSEFVPGAKPIIEVAAPLLFGGLIAGLFYELVGEPLREKVAAVINALFGSDLSE